MERIAMMPRGWLLVLSLLCLQPAVADIATPEQNCLVERSAICERNGLKTYIDGPCPAGSRTLRPYSDQDCQQLLQRGRPPAEQKLPQQQTAPAVQTPRGDAARASDQWLVAVLRFGPWCLVALGLAFAALSFKKQRRRGYPAGVIVARWIICGGAGAAAGMASGLVTFGRVMASFNNTDTAVAALVAVAAGSVVLVVAAVLTAFVLARLLNRTSLRSRAGGEGGTS
jgi:hypothetical protein